MYFLTNTSEALGIFREHIYDVCSRAGALLKGLMEQRLKYLKKPYEKQKLSQTYNKSLDNGIKKHWSSEGVCDVLVSMSEVSSYIF